jgi:hypothetical protein
MQLRLFYCQASLTRTFALIITGSIINYYRAYCHYSLCVNNIKYHVIAESSFFILSGYQET